MKVFSSKSLVLAISVCLILDFSVVLAVSVSEIRDLGNGFYLYNHIKSLSSLFVVTAEIR